MPSIREMALSKVTELSAVEKIELATKYNLKEFMLPGFVDLSLEGFAPKPMSKGDGQKIGYEGLLILAEVKREVENNLQAYLDRAKVAEFVEKKLDEAGLLD